MLQCKRCKQIMDKQTTYSHFLFCNESSFRCTDGNAYIPKRLYPKANNPIRSEYMEQFEEVK